MATREPIGARWEAALRLAEMQAAESTLTLDGFLAALGDTEPYTMLGGDFSALDASIFAYNAPYIRQAAPVFWNVARQAESRGVAGACAMVAPALFRLRARLHSASEQVVILQLNVARLRGELAGDTGEERELQFGRMLLNREFRMNCRETYPVLDETLQFMTEDAIAHWSEFFERLADDWSMLESIVPGGLVALKELTLYAGDPHNRGRSVTIVQGEGGTIVYKPRYLDTDMAFGRTLAWLDSDMQMGLRHPEIIARDDYGWVEFIPHRECETLDEVAVCYERSGALVGLLFLLCGSDLHYENIICSGAEPYFVDVEALFTGPLAAHTPQIRREVRFNALTPLSTLYFPQAINIAGNVVDISGAGYAAGQAVRYKGISRDSGDVRLDWLETTSPASSNLPTLGGVPQSALEHADAVVRGFRNCLEAMWRNRDAFLCLPDLFPAFSSVRSRHISRPTFRYTEVLRSALHPHCCKNRALHGQALSGIAPGIGAKEGAARRILAADILALRRGDIPFFKSSADSLAIRTTEGVEIPDVFQKTGHESVARRIAELNRNTIEAHVSAVKLAFSAAYGPTPASDKPSTSVVSISREIPVRDRPSRDIRLAAAIGIGEWLLDRAYRDGKHVTWVGRVQFGSRFCANPVDAGLYGGVAGIGVFLAELAKRTGDRRFRRLGLACLRTMRDSRLSTEGPIGAFDGVAGAIYADILISRALAVEQAPSLEAWIARIERFAPDHRHFDIISGTAGALLVLVNAREFVPHALVASLERAAHVCARHLIDNASISDGTVSWPSAGFETNLTGVAHGACGIAMALAEYAVMFGDQDAWERVYEGLAYAGPTFEAKHGFWRDLRFNDTAEPGGSAWCHGAGGMTLARQRIVALDETRANDQVRLDIERGLNALTRLRDQPPDTLCHGRCGDWEALWRGRSEHRSIALSEALAFSERWLKGSFPRGDLSEPTPDLMNGQAGVGMQLLRSIDQSAPCVSLLSF